MHLERGISLKKKIEYYKITPKDKDKYTNGIHVWDNQWPHAVSTQEDPKEAHFVQDAQKKYEGSYYQELV